MKFFPGRYENEDAIKSDLRDLTEQTRKLRQELQGMLTRPQTDPARHLSHVPPWPDSKRPDPTAEGRPRRRRKQR
jgi:hypothetical protein